MREYLRRSKSCGPAVRRSKLDATLACVLKAQDAPLSEGWIGDFLAAAVLGTMTWFASSPKALTITQRRLLSASIQRLIAIGIDSTVGLRVDQQQKRWIQTYLLLRLNMITRSAMSPKPCQQQPPPPPRPPSHCPAAQPIHHAFS